MSSAVAPSPDHAAAAASPAPTMKLLIDAKAKRVLYAEAGKDAVDFLFGILATPVGTVAKLLRAAGDGAGAANIYASAEGMNLVYMQSSAVRNALLNSHRYTLLQCPAIRGLPSPATTAPPAPSTSVPRSMALPSVSYRPQYPAVAPPAFAMTVPRGCHSCGSVVAGGFVQGLVTYTVMDDLTSTPMSNVSVMALLSKLNGEEKGLILEEKSVKIGQQEGLDILMASLQSSTVLTDVFMSNNSADASLSKNKRARTSGGAMSVEEKNDKTLDYFL
ncbi:hypothetical protein CFC21_039771 [Triticum aestivum]|uniref:DUF674 domain-containing protein n=3 Tax=Triticum aestivum TaxID=4565 RepID=A0A9R1FF62_WHEAT|nr:hypothetical protein CFC21_039771 [Triticum aestivum]